MTSIFKISIVDFLKLVDEYNGVTTKEISKNFGNKSTTNERFSKKTISYIISGLAFAICILLLIIFLISYSLTSSQVYSMVNPSVFCITTTTDITQYSGTGFFIDDNGTAITNYHVIENALSAEVTLSDGENIK